VRAGGTVNPGARELLLQALLWMAAVRDRERSFRAKPMPR
jgi:hypothetical protein